MSLRMTKPFLMGELSLVHGVLETHSYKKLLISQDLSGSCLTNLRNELHGPQRFRKKCFIMKNLAEGRTVRSSRTAGGLEEAWFHQAE